MGDIINLADQRLRRQQPKPVKQRVTIEALTIEAVDFLLGDWGKMVKTNRLNDYFKMSVPLLDKTSNINYMSDLNEVAALELNIDLSPIIFCPGTHDLKQVGWLVQFILAGHKISTPLFASEPYARAFAVLLFLKLKRDALTHGLIT